MYYVQLERLCREKGVSVASVCRELGFSNSVSTAWKNGSSPKGEVVVKFADYFGVTTDYLLGKTNDPNPTLLNIPEPLQGVRLAFDRGEFEDLTQSEVDALAEIAKTLKAQRRL